MYAETITLFNRYHSRLGDTWYPHVLHGVNLITDKADIVAKYGAESADNASLHVKYSNSDDGIKIADIPYLPPKRWAAQTNDKLADTITFNSSAQYFDFFILGEYDDLSPIVEPRGTEENLYEKLRNEKDFCYAITSVSNPYKVIPHFEIMAK